MSIQRSVVALLAVALATSLAARAGAQADAKHGELAQPDYGSGTAGGVVSDTNFNSPTSDGRPGQKFYAQGMNAYRRGDLSHALHMLRLAAFWGYAPAAYNLGVIYFQGEGGQPVNRPLGTAWMFIAAQRGSSTYVDARHMMVGELDNAERAKALDLLQGLQGKYGNKVAMRRAENQWQFVRANQTGTHVGGTVGELRVGIRAGGGAFHTPMNSGGSTGTYRHSWMSVLGGGSVDGDMAYQQLQQSTNPYAPVFIKNRAGNVTVEPLQPTKGGVRQQRNNKQGTPSQPQPGSSSPDL